MGGLSEKEKENDANYAKHAKSGALAGENESLQVEPSTASILRYYFFVEQIYLSSSKATAHCLLSSHVFSLSEGTRHGFTRMPSRYVTWQDSRSFAKLSTKRFRHDFQR